MKKHFMKRGLSLLLAFVMMFGMIQTPLFTQEVEAATLDASDASYDYDVSKMKVAAGSVEDSADAGANEGSILNAFDYNESTIWHTKWNPGGANKDLWVVMALEEKTEVDAVRWWSRGANGDITKYQIYGTTDNVDINEDDGNAKNNTIRNADEVAWSLIMEDTWTAGNGWKIAEFETQELTAIKVVALESVGDANRSNYFASAKEIRIRTTEPADPIPVDPIPVSPKPANGTTQNQPFARGTARSDKFRIPALITTKNETLVAAIDARWNTHSDALGIDTIVSTSTDDGANWNYTFANYLGDYGNESSNPNSEKAYAATFIDPELIYDPNVGEKGTIYMLVDLYAGGYAINTAPMGPVSGDPFTAAGYLKLKASSSSSYDYYLKEGKIYRTDNTEVAGYTVDGHFNLFYNGEAAGNLFFNAADYLKKPAYQVLPTTYLYLTKSTDDGATWSAPQLLDVKGDDEYFYGVGPGRGIVTSDGVLMFSCYKFAGSDAQRSSVIYSTDNGATWKRTENATSSIWSSESQLVELSDGTIRMFFRNGQGCVCYVDATKGTDASGNRIYTWGDYKTTSVSNHSNCQISAMMYSKKIDGKDAILVACPSNTSSRSVGKIFVGLVNADKSMDWKYSYAGFGNGYFQYSCMTELKDGSIGILYEDCSTTDGSAVYKKIAITDIVGNANIGGFWVETANGNAAANVTMKPGDAATYSIFGEAAGNLTVTSSDTNVATVTLNTAATVAEGDTAVATFTVTANPNFKGFGTTTITVSDGTESTSFEVKVLSGTTDNYETVELKVGEKATFTDKTGYYVGQETGVDSSKATVELQGTSNSSVTVAQLGTDVNFNGSYAKLEDCLYTFTSTGTGNQYTISAETSGGTVVYFNSYYADNKPNVTNTDGTLDLSVDVVGNTNGTFAFHTMKSDEGNVQKWIHFRKAKTELYFDRCNGDSGASGIHHQFEIYAPSANATESPIKGYEKLTSIDQIENGGKYLIVAYSEASASYTGDGNRYVLYPYSGGEKYNHIAKVTEGYFERTVQVGASVTNDTNVSFTNGTIRGLSELLYTFEEVTDTAGNSGYRVFVKNEDNTPRLYLSLRKSGSVDGRRPHMAEDGSVIQFTNVSGNEGSYIIKDAKGWSDNGENGSHLHFYAAASKNHHSFDRCGTVGSADIENHTYRIYRPVKNNETASTELPGYVRVMSLDSIENGGQYLIAVYDDNTLFFLNPPANANDANYLHVAQLTNGIVATNSGTTEITITGVAGGSTEAVVGNTTYYIAVEGEEVEEDAINLTIAVGQQELIEGRITKQPETAGVVSASDEIIANAPYTVTSSIEEGRYLISTKNKSHILKNTMSSSNDWKWLGFQLQSVSVSNDVINIAYPDYVFTLKNVDGVSNGYTIQNSKGKYLNFALRNNEEYNDGWGFRATVSWGDSPQTIFIAPANGGGYSIYTELNGKNYGLNNYGGANALASGYSNFNDGWYFFKASETSEVVISGQTIGNTKMSIDNKTYNITVVDYVDYTVLNQQIEIASALENDTSYTTDSIENLKSVLAKAQAFTQITTPFASVEELKAAQDAADAMEKELTEAIKALKRNMKHYSMDVNQEAVVEIEGALKEGTYDDTERGIATVTVSADGTKMTIKGNSPGFVELEVGATTYHILICPIAEGFPIIAETGKGAATASTPAGVVTKLTISADLEFDFGYNGTETVKWTTPEIKNADNEKIVTISEQGVLTIDRDSVKTTIATTVTATIDGVGYTIPVVIHPAPSSDTNKKEVDFYIEKIDNVEVYYSWNCSTDLIHASIGEVIYYNAEPNEPLAIDFMAAPHDGYALTFMDAPGGQGDYMTVHTGDDQTLDTSDKGFLNYFKDGHGAGVTQSQDNMFGKEQVMAMLYEGIVRQCDGAMGFSRPGSDHGIMASTLAFQAEKLPTVEKTVHGILPANIKRAEYRPYTEGMTATEGEYVYFQVKVTTYRPLTFKTDTTKSMIEYANAFVIDDQLAGASFITDKGKDTILRPDQIIPSPAEVEEDITKILNDQTWAEGEETKEILYYVAYQIKAEDLGTDIINKAELEYNYKAEYSTGSYDAVAAADAKITVSDFVERELVVDFGLPVSITLPTWGKVAKSTEAGEEDYDIVRLDTTGTATATYGDVVVEEVKDTLGDTTGWKVTYTPKVTLKGTDTITLFENVGKDKRMPAQFKIKVHPASSVYYEENFMIPSTKGQWPIEKKFTELQEAAHPGYTLQKPTANYGYDAAYTTGNVTEAVSSLAQTDAANGVKEKATFTFTGTGVDVFANCDVNTGIVMVMVKDNAGALKKMFTVDTNLRLGAIDEENKAALGSETTNIPIVSIPADGLAHGDYQVLLVHTPKKVVTETTVDGEVVKTTTPVATNLRIDGFRVYGTLSDAEALAVHGRDNEAFPLYKDIKDSVMAGMTIDFTEGEYKYKEQLANNLLSQVYAANGEKVGGALLVTKGTTNKVYMSDKLDFLDNTSKNELYVYPGQSLVLPLEAAVKNPQLAMKALNGTAKYTITKTEGQTTETGAETEIIANTEMYYLLSMLQDADKNQLATTFTITNTGTTAIAVTKLKVIVDKDVVTPAVFTELTEDDLMPALAAFDAETPEDGGEQLPQGPVVNRIAGSDRYETAYKVADALKETLGVDKFDAVIVATGKNFADALSGSYLAYVKNAPILLTNDKRVDEVVTYVKENLAKGGMVYILGGKEAVPLTVEAGLEGIDVKRLAGGDRYETNIAVLKEAGATGRELLIATGRGYADSLSASATKRPILLVKDKITEDHRAILRGFDGGKLYIIGGTDVVSEEIQTAIAGHGRIYRLAGDNRYGTSVKVAETFFPEAQTACFAYAKEFADGISGGPLAAALGAPMILTADGKTDDAAAYVQSKEIQNGIVFGGTTRISDDSAKLIFGLEKDTKIVLK